MAIKIEDKSDGKLPRNTISNVEKILTSVPKEHLRGIDRVRLVEYITDSRARLPAKLTQLPGLYHPRQGTQQPWLEVALGALIPRDKPMLKQIVPRLSFKGNLAAVVFSLVGQHYYLTLRHSVKRGQLEPAVRTYVEKQLKSWNEQQHSFRANMFKTIQPTLERWGKTLQKRAAAERKKKG